MNLVDSNVITCTNELNYRKCLLLELPNRLNNCITCFEQLENRSLPNCLRQEECELEAVG